MPEGPEPHVELAVTTLDPSSPLYVEEEGKLVAALELVSPRNKDRPSARMSQTSRYASYLVSGINLMLIDVHHKPAGFSFADAIAQELETRRPPLPAPMAVSYRVGEPAAAGGRYVAFLERALSHGAELPRLPLPLSVHKSVWLDLELTYLKAAADAYLT